MSTASSFIAAYELGRSSRIEQASVGGVEVSYKFVITRIRNIDGVRERWHL